MSAPQPPDLKRLSSDEASSNARFWFGMKTRDSASVFMAYFLTFLATLAGLCAGGLFAISSHFPGHEDWSLALLYDVFIPGLALGALSVTLLLGTRVAAQRGCKGSARMQRFGRKCFIISAASILFTFSCFYRAINIADEGAATCRGQPTAFNAPVAGRLVATIGEVALVVQIATYIRETSERLGAKQGLWSNLFLKWTSIRFSTIIPALCAETMSWSGLLSGNSKFFCAEYVLWMVIASTWIWDSAGMLQKSQEWSDQVAHASLLLASGALCFFNAVYEIPHFFMYNRAADASSQANQVHIGIWECSQEPHSPLWLKRLPFFVCYFIGSSWCSIAITYRFLRRNKPKEL